MNPPPRIQIIKLLNFFFFFFFIILFNSPTNIAAAAAAAATTSHVVVAHSYNTSFDFRSFTLRNFTLLGDSYLRNGLIGLTQDVTVPSSTSSSLIYTNPIPFFDQDSNTTSSFSTSFTFSITNVNPSSFGDVLCFFLSQDNQTLDSSGCFLGLVNSTHLTKNRFVAVEFDTRLDAHFNDPKGNHVDLDIDSLVSLKTADPFFHCWKYFTIIHT